MDSRGGPNFFGEVGIKKIPPPTIPPTPKYELCGCQGCSILHTMGLAIYSKKKKS